MSAKNLVCWKCGDKLPSHCLPIGHYDLCPHCREDLRTCRMCRSFDPNVSGKCRKEEADYVSNKERANYCHYFSPRANAHKAIEDKSQQALNDLASFFGDEEPSTEPLSKDYKQQSKDAQKDLHQLFGGQGDVNNELTPEEKAKNELDKLFGK